MRRAGVRSQQTPHGFQVPQEELHLSNRKRTVPHTGDNGIHVNLVLINRASRLTL